jgi:hypothetical protein
MARANPRAAACPFPLLILHPCRRRKTLPGKAHMADDFGRPSSPRAAGSAGAFSSMRGGNSGRRNAVALNGAALRRSWTPWRQPQDLCVARGRVGGSAARSGSSRLWPRAPVRPRIGAGPRPFSVVFGGVCGGLWWWSVGGRFGGTYTASMLAGG